MLSATDFWMCLAGLVSLVAGIFVLRKEIGAARGWDKLITLGTVFIAASLAAFAPEHFHGPQFIQNVVPRWMPARAFWPRFVGCALLAAAASLTARKCVRLSSTLLASMFSLFVCLIYLPSALAHYSVRLAWVLLLRDLSFAAGAWALVGLHSRTSSPRSAKWMVSFGRIAIAVAAIFFAAQHFLHPQFAPGVPSVKVPPSWVPLPSAWSYVSSMILLSAGIGLALNRRSRTAATSIGALMTVLTLFLYLPILITAHGSAAINEAMNYVADTLLYAGSALVLASALPRIPERAMKTHSTGVHSVDTDS